MTTGTNAGQLYSSAPTAPSAYDAGSDVARTPMTESERDDVVKLGNKQTKDLGGVWLLLNGRFRSESDGAATESEIQELLCTVFGYPDLDRPPKRTLNVVVDSPGGSLDSAYKTVLYLSQFAAKLNVYVPYRAKSASTLLAVGADRTYLSPFAELGPLDTQIADPRNPANTTSALDCYQSVDYVREFAFQTILSALPKLITATERRLPVTGLIDTATQFATSSVAPMLKSVTALDFGSWGRSLRIGESYAVKLLKKKSTDEDEAAIKQLAWQLVYGYAHHRFPIDYREAERIGLTVERMSPSQYKRLRTVVDACRKKSFIGFLSKQESEKESHRSRKPASKDEEHSTDEHPQADVGGSPVGIGSRYVAESDRQT
ncbi:SDH family Clp fold serine proteinase [Saccharomonospora xinjiangensis]|uniref:ClpP class periplasmic serine protease n=1 Tax=Saccharomonospora xinjiangensis XJ-54 TaxID=882086 RepID=I0UY86_9PSEU|nr:ClpP class periplasmic serine protease [Saccharomonospora xinjiangensis]EID52839.1 ClpP class periplasmic serine protease [Saccharomonospora xinjiangensis XJ-54]